MEKNILEVFIGLILLLLGFLTISFIIIKSWRQRIENMLLSQWMLRGRLWKMLFFWIRFNPYKNETWQHINIFYAKVFTFTLGIIFIIGGIVCFIDYFWGIPR